jgi:hypothetical protein
VFSAGRVALDGVLLLGPSHPVSRELEGVARSVFETCGAHALLAQLDRVLAGSGAAVSPR